MRALRAGCRWWPRAWSSSSAAPGGARKPLKEWELEVGPRGRLRVRLPCEVSVRPLEPRRRPGSDRLLLVTVRGDRRDPERVRVRYDEELQLAAIAAEGVGSGAAVEVRAPAEFDLDIKTSGTGCVKIQKIECSNCKIETEKGTSVLQSIKSHKIDIRTKGGKVIGLGTLCGNTDIHATEKGFISLRV